MIDIDFKFPEWAERVKAKEKELNLFVAAQVQFNRGMIFDQEGAYNGRGRWDDLKFRSGQILSKRGTLRKSIAPYNPKGIPGPDGIVHFAGEVITVGTKLLYARMMNDGTTKMPGGVLRPVRAKALKIPIPQGKNATEAAQEINRQSAQKNNKEKLRELESKLHKTKQGSKSFEKILTKMAALQQAIEQKTTTKGASGFIFRKSVRIPARPFDDWNEQDQQNLDAALLNKIAEILNEGSAAG